MRGYLEYLQDDFIMDLAFREWIQKPTQDSNKFWNNFLLQHPEKENAINAAKLFLTSPLFTENISFSEKENMWKEVNAAIQKEKAGKLVFMKKEKPVVLRKIGMVAAAVFFACALLLGILYYTPNSRSQMAQTKFGEISNIYLPDSSQVTLNANSNLTYNKAWKETGDREVWIEGEAFFSVKHRNNNQRFIVHTEAMDIEVLGTEFNVMNREDKLKVSLNSGSIKLNVHENSTETLFMKPGEVIELSLKSKNLKKKVENVENISAWKKNKLVCDDTPLSEIITRLNYLYGWEFAKVDEELLKETLTGEVPTDNEDKLIRTLESGFRVRIIKEGKVVSIMPM